MQLCSGVQFQWSFLDGRQIDIDIGNQPQSLLLMCLSTIFCVVFSMKNGRLIEWSALDLVQLALLGLAVNVTLTCLQAVGVFLPARQPVKIRHMWVIKRWTHCCKRAGAISSVSADLNGLNIFITHFILDWSVTFMDSSPSSLWAVYVFKFGCLCHYQVTSSALDPRKWTLYYSSKFLSLLVCGVCW